METEFTGKRQAAGDRELNDRRDQRLLQICRLERAAPEVSETAKTLFQRNRAGTNRRRISQTGPDRTQNGSGKDCTADGDHMRDRHPSQRTPVYNRRGSQTRPGAHRDEMKTPDHPDPGQALQETQTLHAKTQYQSRRDLYKQKRQFTEPQADMGRHERPLPTCRRSGQESFPPQPETSFCKEFLQSV